MQPLTVVKYRDVLDDVCSGLLAGLIVAPVEAPDFKEPKKLSTTALSQQSPLWLMLPSIPWSLSSFRKTRLAYCTPRSEW